MVAGLAIRSAVAADAVACARILNDRIDATAWMPRCHTPDEVERHYREVVLVKRETTVAERRGDVVGYIAVARSDACVTAPFVDAKALGDGLGNVLLGHVAEAKGAARAASDDGRDLEYDGREKEHTGALAG